MIIAGLCYRLYARKNYRLRSLLLSLVSRAEGGEIYSRTMRRIFKDYHKVEIGLYTHGGCFVPGQVDKHTTIGRYCSFARTMRVMNRNHPMNFKSSHGFFFNPALGYSSRDPIEYLPLAIGNDVWVGHNAIILPPVGQIGSGAVVAAGAVVAKNVPPYAVVSGYPARVVRYRFGQEAINELLASCWWEKSIEEIRPDINDFQRPYGPAQA